MLAGYREITLFGIGERLIVMCYAGKEAFRPEHMEESPLSARYYRELPL